MKATLRSLFAPNSELISFFTKPFFGRNLGAFLLVMFGATTAIAQPGVTTQPSNFPTTCQPNGNTIFTHTQAFVVEKGNCGNNGAFSFVWQYNNGTTVSPSWVAVSSNMPVGFIAYNLTSTSTGIGSNVVGTSKLAIELSSTASTGTFEFRCVASHTGCSPANTRPSNTITFTVNPKPTPTFTSQAGAAGCVNSNYTYTTQTGQTGYSWNVPGVLNTDYLIVSGNLGTTSNSATLKWLTPGNKTVSINYTNVSGCTASSPTLSTTTAVGSQPTPTFTTGPGASTCANTDLTYTTQLGFTNYVWTFEGIPGVDYSITSGGTLSSNTVVVKWLTAGSKTVNVNYNNSNGCNAALAASSTTIVNARPSPTFTAFPDVNTCANTDITYTTQSGQTGYLWTIPGTAGVDYAILAGGTGAGSNTVTLQWITSGSKTVTVNYTNSDGCNASISESSTTAVSFAAIPAINAVGSLTFCEGGSVTLNTGAATTFQWYNDGVLIPGATSQSYIASSSATYTVKVSNAAGCEAISVGVIVTENPLPDITISTQASSLCLSASSQTSKLDYTNTDNSPTTYSITWNAAPGFTNIIDGAFPFASFFDIAVPANAAAGTYTASLTVKNANGCTSSTKTFSVLITSPPDVSNFSLSATDGCVGTGSVITINSTSLVNGTYAVTYDLTGANTATGNTAVMIFNNLTGTFTANALNAGATDITVTQVAFVGCVTPVIVNNTASFIINSLPALDLIAGPATVCVDNTINLTNATSGGTWSTSEPSIATVSNTGLVSGFLPGSVMITYTTAPDPTTGCTNSTTKNLTVELLPNVEAITGPTTLCINTTANLNNATSGGTWASSNAAVATIDVNTGLVTALSLGTTIITYTTTANAAGCINSTMVSVSVEPPPTVTAGAEIEVCESASPTAIVLSGASFGGSATSATWVIEAGGGILSITGATTDPSSVTYTPPANFSGTVTLSLTTNAPNSCTPVSQTRTIEVTEKSLVVPGSSITVCESPTPGAITLSGASIGGGATTGAWSIITGGGSLSDNSQTTDPASVTYTPAANFAGLVTLTLTSNATGSCSPVSADRTINVTAPPTANAGTDLNTCGNVGAINITTGSGATNYISVGWESSGSGTFTNVTSLTIATYTPSEADILAGSVTITLRANGGACIDATSSKVLTITKAATANAGSEIIICSAPGAIDITTGAIAANYTAVEWTSNGTGTITNPNSITTATYTPGANELGIITLTLKATGNSPCIDVTSTKSLTINPNATISLTSVLSTASQTPCINTAITNITYAIGGGGTGATFSGLPNGVTGAFSGGVATINGTPTVSGLFNYTVTTTGTCAPTSAFGSINVSPATSGGTLSPALATGCTGTSGTITLTGSTGAVVKWEFSTNGGVSWTDILNTTATHTYSNLTQTTIYRALLQSGVCSNTYSSISVISVVPHFNPTTVPTPAVICAGQTSVLTSTSGYPTSGISDEAGSFSDANPAGWRRDGQSTESFLPANRDNTSSGPWGETNGPKVFSGISYDGAGGKFAIVDGNLTSLLETPVFSLIGQTSVNFQFSHAYNLKAGATATIEISTDGGTTYSALNILAQYAGISSFGITGSTGLVQPTSISLAKYIGLSNLRIRFRYEGGTTNSSWALDNVKVPATLPITYLWTDPATIITDPTQASVTVQPTVTTTYTLTTYVNGCPAGTSTVTVTVNPLPTITPSEPTGGSVRICYSTASQNLPLSYTATDIPLPATYSITWDPSALAAGFLNVTAPLPGGSVGLVIPAGASPATYTGIITINNANGCVSPQAPFSVVVKPLPVISVPTPALICRGTTITLTASGAVTYTWFPATGLSATSGFSVLANPTVTTTYTITGTSDLGCVNTTTVTVSVTTGYIWTGLGIPDNKWTNPLNWTVCGVPPDHSSVTIPDVTNQNYPLLDVDFISNNFDLLGNATIQLNGHTLSLGDATTSIINQEGLIVGSNTSNLIVMGWLNLDLKFSQTNAGLTNVLKDLTINSNSLTVTLGNPLRIIGNVIPTAGVLDSDGNLTMVSTANTSSNITEMNTASDVIGDVNVQSYITGDGISMLNRGFRSISSPINDALILTGKKTYRFLKDSIIVTGPGGEANGFDQGGIKQPYAETLTLYNEGIGAGLPAFVAVPHIDQANIPGSGLLAFFRGRQGESYALNYNKLNEPFVAPEAVTLNYRGPINKFDMPLVVLHNSSQPGDAFNGYNLIGNPYPSSIDWLQVGRSFNVLNTVIIVMPGGRQASYIDGVSNNGGTDIIQPGQGFYVRTSVEGETISFNEDCKSTLYPARLLNAPQKEIMTIAGMSALNDQVKNGAAQLLRLNLQDGKNTDETTLVFKEGKSPTAGYEDALYFSGSTVTLASISSDNRNLAINGLPEIGEVKEIRLNVNSAQSGKLKLSFTDLAAAEGYRVWLKDVLNPSGPVDVRKQPEYTFNLDRSQPGSYGNQRFSILLEFDPAKLLSFKAGQIKQLVNLNWEIKHGLKSADFELERSADTINFNSLGKVKGGTGQLYSFTDKDPIKGNNYYRLKIIDAGERFFYSTIIKVDYKQKGLNGETRPDISLFPNPAKDEFNLEFNVISNHNIQVNMYDARSLKVKSNAYNLKDNALVNQRITDLLSGVYIVEVVDLNNKRTLKRLKIIKE